MEIKCPKCNDSKCVIESNTLSGYSHEFNAHFNRQKAHFCMACQKYFLTEEDQSLLDSFLLKNELKMRKGGSFDPEKEFKRIKEWFLEYMMLNASSKTPIIVGLSGGKDSTITAAACVNILGSNRVIGISMPDYEQNSDKAFEIAYFLGIRFRTIKIGGITEFISESIKAEFLQVPNDTMLWNLAPRIRMSVLYAIANQLGGRVANTCNMSETYVGYDTRWGDQCGDFSLFQNYTATEVKEIGKYLGVPDEFVEVPPSDGLCGMTDEERWGFTYKELDTYLRSGEIYPPEISKEVVDKIRKMNKAAKYKTISISIPAVSYFPGIKQV